MPRSLLIEGGCGYELLRLTFIGDGHRKVWARLRYGKGIRVAKKRVLTIMREHNLLSPYRSPQKPPREHDGQIITTEPNIMWATDGAKGSRVTTAGAGYSRAWSTGTRNAWDGT